VFPLRKRDKEWSVIKKKIDSRTKSSINNLHTKINHPSLNLQIKPVQSPEQKDKRQTHNTTKYLVWPLREITTVNILKR
jgi:hypothetical protein